MKKIQGMVFSAARCPRPPCIPRSRPRGAKAQGLNFERALALSLGGAIHGQWFSYEDSSGPHFCQTDLLVVGGRALIIECKLTWLPEAWAEVKGFYVPVVAK